MNKEDEAEQTNRHNSRLSSGNVQGNSFNWLLPPFDLQSLETERESPIA